MLPSVDSISCPQSLPGLPQKPAMFQAGILLGGLSFPDVPCLMLRALLLCPGPGYGSLLFFGDAPQKGHLTPTEAPYLSVTHHGPSLLFHLTLLCHSTLLHGPTFSVATYSPMATHNFMVPTLLHASGFCAPALCLGSRPMATPAPNPNSYLSLCSCVIKFQVHARHCCQIRVVLNLEALGCRGSNRFRFLGPTETLLAARPSESVWLYVRLHAHVCGWVWHV